MKLLAINDGIMANFFFLLLRLAQIFFSDKMLYKGNKRYFLKPE